MVTRTTQYVPAMVPTRLEDIPYYLRSELERIAAAFGAIQNIQLTELNVALDKPRDGMVIFADGTNFDPGNGQGIYARINGGWKQLDGLGGTPEATIKNPSTLVLRDVNARAEIATPTTDDEIANKAYVDAAVPAHTAEAVAATIDTLALRDGAGRSKMVDPAVDADIATKKYVDDNTGAIPGLTMVLKDNVNYQAVAADNGKLIIMDIGDVLPRVLTLPLISTLSATFTMGVIKAWDSGDAQVQVTGFGSELIHGTTTNLSLGIAEVCWFAHDGTSWTVFNKHQNSLVQGVRTKSGDYKITEAEDGYLFSVTTGASTITITLPAENEAVPGFTVGIKKADSGAGKVVINPGFDDIDQWETYELRSQGATIWIINDGDDWHTLSQIDHAWDGTGVVGVP